VVAGDDDEVLALEPVEVGLRLSELLLEAERRQVAGADDEIRAEVVDLADRPLHEARHEVRPAAVNVGDMRDLEGSIRGRHGRSVRRSEPRGAYPRPLLS
jgi:hypothetical protein